jgi:dienelactone hydrolase
VYTSGRRYPLIIVQYRSRGFLRGGIGDEYPIHVFSASGFAVLSFHRPDDWELQPLVRSYDELEARNHVDLRERRRILSVLLAGIDYLADLGIVDSRRVGLTGFSDGGETVGFALTSESQRFAAAAASWIAHSPTGWYVYGPKFQRVLSSHGLGYPRGPTAERWQRLSLALNAEHVMTPLLLQVSDQELLPETETFAALEAHGRPVELYVFPNEYHVKLQPRHRLAVYRRSLQWFQFWLQGIEAHDPMDADQYARWRTLRTLRNSIGGAQPDLGSEGSKQRSQLGLAQWLSVPQLTIDCSAIQKTLPRHHSLKQQVADEACVPADDVHQEPGRPALGIALPNDAWQVIRECVSGEGSTATAAQCNPGR